jgi:hypothetical protein
VAIGDGRVAVAAETTPFLVRAIIDACDAFLPDAITITPARSAVPS